ncbi:MAG TPA: SRPBCC domain-containing protein [Acidobacteriaceae bacterium]
MNSTAPDTRTVVLERTFPHTPETLWSALTEGHLLAEWLMNNNFEPVTGREFQFRAQPVPHWDGVIDCKVLVIDPLKTLSYTWRSMGLDSVVLFTLSPTSDGTHLRVEHSGFRPDQHAAFQGATFGWQKFFTSLERLLDRKLA